ncbi:hypothetical protein [Pseudocitrobacter cyperus]|uniref:Uncharacterized protein n=1 Tax=Pseudocitrobacter cyperus TaxID=3112843 RepID=A0ABV0HE82_9ENTR
MRLNYYLLIFLLMPFYCLSGTIKDIETCELNEGLEVKLISLRTIDGDTPYLVFDNVIVNAFLEGKETSGDLVLAKCINHSLIFALNYGSPYIKGCLITGLIAMTKVEVKPDWFCFAERNIPESVWFGKINTLIIIKNDNAVGEWQGRYVIYDNTKETYSSDALPDTNGYEIYNLSNVH